MAFPTPKTRGSRVAGSLVSLFPPGLLAGRRMNTGALVLLLVHGTSAAADFRGNADSRCIVASIPQAPRSPHVGRHIWSRLFKPNASEGFVLFCNMTQ